MKISLIWVGKTQDKYLDEGNNLFLKRLRHYVQIDIIEIKDFKGKISDADLKAYEAKEVLNHIEPSDHVILLDEGGKLMSSVEFSESIENMQVRGIRKCIFVIGGAFGFDKSVYDRANEKLSLSKMTFSHRMIRLFFLEQLYRAFTILKNEKYHNE